MRFAMFRCIVPYFPQNGFKFFFLEFVSLFWFREIAWINGLMEFC